MELNRKFDLFMTISYTERTVKFEINLKITCFPDTCAMCTELPTNTSTMPFPVLKNYSGLLLIYSSDGLKNSMRAMIQKTAQKARVPPAYKNLPIRFNRWACGRSSGVTLESRTLFAIRRNEVEGLEGFIASSILLSFRTLCRRMV